MPHGLPDPVVEKLRSVFKQYPQVSRVSLYGSRAKGNFQPGSDIDLCVEGNVLTLADLFEIENRIDDLLLPWKVDMSLKHRIHNPELLEHIERVGVKLFETDSSEGALQED